MVIRKSEKKVKKITNCHGGHGLLHCTEMLADYKKIGAGFKYIHDNVLEPGASIGEHTHSNDEEIYVILSGSGTMKVDGKVETVGTGDVCLTRHGHSHDLTNTGKGPMTFLVICTNLGTNRS